MFSLTGYLTEILNTPVYNNVDEPDSQTVHVQADVTLKF